jgi:hypothetical protein
MASVLAFLLVVGAVVDNVPRLVPLNVVGHRVWHAGNA